MPNDPLLQDGTLRSGCSVPQWMFIITHDSKIFFEGKACNAEYFWLVEDPQCFYFTLSIITLNLLCLKQLIFLNNPLLRVWKYLHQHEIHQMRLWSSSAPSWHCTGSDRFQIMCQPTLDLLHCSLAAAGRSRYPTILLLLDVELWQQFSGGDRAEQEIEQRNNLKTPSDFSN